jgi:hypothetical protein
MKTSGPNIREICSWIDLGRYAGKLGDEGSHGTSYHKYNVATKQTRLWFSLVSGQPTFDTHIQCTNHERLPPRELTLALHSHVSRLPNSAHLRAVKNIPTQQPWHTSSRMRAFAHSTETHHVSMLRTIIAAGCLIWFVVVWFVCAIGFTQL